MSYDYDPVKIRKAERTRGDRGYPVAILSIVKLNGHRRYGRDPDERGTVVGIDLKTDVALVVWSHKPDVVNRYPYSWLVEVAS